MNCDFDNIKSDTEYSSIPRKIRINLKLSINSLLNMQIECYLNKIYIERYDNERV